MAINNLFKKELSLEKYLYLGGKIENINFENNNVYSGYSGDRNFKQKIVSIKESNSTIDGTIKKLFEIEFENGTIKKYASMWINLSVEMVLYSEYTK